MNKEQRASLYYRWEHIHNVQTVMNMVVTDLLKRALNHDQSKFKSPEAELFAEYSEQLKNTLYGSEEHTRIIKRIESRLDTKLPMDRHHPDAFTNKTEDMNFIDLLEYVCDMIAYAKDSFNENKIWDILKEETNTHNIPTPIAKLIANTILFIITKDETFNE